MVDDEASEGIIAVDSSFKQMKLSSIRGSKIHTQRSGKKIGWVFRWFLFTIKHAQRACIKQIRVAFVYFNLISMLGLFLFMTVSDMDDLENSCYLGVHMVLVPLNLVAVFLSGVHVPLLILTGLQIIRHEGVLLPLLLDMITWLVTTISLCVGAKSIMCSITGEMQTFSVIIAFVFSVRLNTCLAADIAVQNLVLVDVDRSAKQRTKSTTMENIIRVINQGDLSDPCKQHLIGMAHECDLDAKNKLARVEFYHFIDNAAHFLEKNLQRRDGDVEAHKSEITTSNLTSMLHDSGLESINGCFKDGEGEDKTILSTIVVASKHVWHSQKWLVSGLVFSLFLTHIGQTGFYFAVGLLVDEAGKLSEGGGFKAGSSTPFSLGLIGIGTIFVVNTLLLFLNCFLRARVVANTSARIRLQLAKSLLYSDQSYVGKYEPSTLSHAFDAEVAKAEEIYGMVMFELMSVISQLLSATIFLAVADYQCAIFVLISIPLVASFRGFETKATNCAAKSDESSARLLSQFQNITRVRKAAQVGNAERFVLNPFKDRLQRAKRDSFNAWFRSNTVDAYHTTAGCFIYIITSIVFLLALADGRIKAGFFFSINAFVLGVIDPLIDFGYLSGQISRLSAAVHQIDQLIKKGCGNEKELLGTVYVDADDSCCSLTLFRKIEFDRVSFGYSPKSPLVLKNLSFDIDAGTYVCIMGPSGSGKSTILHILMGFFQCTSGRILINGTSMDNAAASIRALRHSTAVVFQEAPIFDGTIRDNIAFGYDREGQSITMKNIVAAAKMAEVHEFIDSLPNKYNTIIGSESRMSLSGGQTQRICSIARALVKKPRLLLLDEATSSLDAVAEHSIFNTLKKLRDDGLTVISVTHRPHTAINADKIILIDGGTVAQIGSYTELSEQTGPFLDFLETPHF